MADNGTPVSDLVVAATKVEQLAVSPNGKPYLRMNLVADPGTGDTDKVWFSGVAFGTLARVLAKKLQKGNKMKVNGIVSQKEYVNKKTDKPGVENKLTIQSCKLSTGSEVLTLDEFTEVA